MNWCRISSINSRFRGWEHDMKISFHSRSFKHSVFGWHTLTLLAANFNLISTAFMFQPTPQKKHRWSCFFNQPPKTHHFSLILAILFRLPQVVFWDTFEKNWRPCWSSSHEYVPQRGHQIWHQPKLRFFLNEQNPWKITSNMCIKFDPSQHGSQKNGPLTIPGLPVTALMYGPSKIHQAVSGAMQRLLGKEKRRKKMVAKGARSFRSVGFF